ncbi:class I SAM-dependent methyltransferase [Actinomarinicola tropica]|uniref:Methyltransferase domain-containing protein n=1 Tax=Actinomarinicola tropica TaxID=2789776 RepID=A0A5Q2RG43_9ACTN|nr:class I SAM-dependent methyltransferase [Actinomarinicola tropica]QGG93772.1 methyltransferase domain-containing protein [Actinomarinicola tropica]
MTTPDPDAVALFSFRVWSYKQGELVSLLVHLGDRLGLYRTLRDAGPVTAAELAATTGYDERWVLEWLRGNAAAELLDSADGTTFALSPEGAAVLADEHDSLAFAAGAFGAPMEPAVVDDLADAFRTGQGLPYDRLGPSGAHRTERMLGPWARLALVPKILPALDGVVDKLEAGAQVADVGCGAGVALTAIAESYPRSRVHGFELSRHALDRAEARVEALALDNVTLHHQRAEDLPTDGRFDLILTFDCLHDMTHPEQAIAAIRRALAPDGTWLVKEIRASGDWTTDRRNPVLAMMYGFSLTSCMSSALSEPGGAGLGTMGLSTDLMREMATAAGFSRFTVHDVDDPANLYYEIRI